jgi:hypothetical protein
MTVLLSLTADRRTAALKPNSKALEVIVDIAGVGRRDRHKSLPDGNASRSGRVQPRKRTGTGRTPCLPTAACGSTAWVGPHPPPAPVSARCTFGSNYQSDRYNSHCKVLTPRAGPASARCLGRTWRGDARHRSGEAARTGDAACRRGCLLSERASAVTQHWQTPPIFMQSLFDRRRDHRHTAG